jgi:hypothetical protein
MPVSSIQNIGIETMFHDSMNEATSSKWVEKVVVITL